MSFSRLAVGFALLIVACHVQVAVSWGLTGHRLTARIAYEYLTQDTQQSLNEMLNGTLYECSEAYEYSPVCYPDQYDQQPDGLWSFNCHFAESKRRRLPYFLSDECWHLCEGSLVDGGYCTKNQLLKQCCVTDGIGKMQDEIWIQWSTGQTNATADAGNTDDLVLKTLLLAHWVGDIHQPMHTDIRSLDQGGNKYNVTWYSNATCEGYYMTMMPCELHLVWDTMIIRNRMARYGPGPPASTGGACKDPREEKYVSDLVAEFTPYIEANALPVLPIQRADPITWINEGLPLSSLAYIVKEDGDCGEEYYASAAPVVDRQLFLAGYRMAAALNFAFDTDASACPECSWWSPLCQGD